MAENGLLQQPAYAPPRDPQVEAEAAAEHAARRARQLAEARAAAAAESRELSALLPGFPQGLASAAELASALARLVPERKTRFFVERKSFKRARYEHGWAFHIETRSDPESRSGAYSRWLVITDRGGRFEPTEGPSATEVSSIMASDWHMAEERRKRNRKLENRGVVLPPATISGKHLLKVRDQVLRWKGRTLTGTLTPAQRELLRSEGHRR